jgi:hypothetical protein
VEDPAKDVDAPATIEKKSIFAKMCGCFGGKAPAPDTDPMEKTVDAVAGDGKAAEVADPEKEEVGEETAPDTTEVPAVVTVA